MRFSPEKAENRREFFRAAARYGLLGLLTAAASLAIRRQVLGGQKCVNRGICPNCGGNLVQRPIRPAAKLLKNPASKVRKVKPGGCAPNP